MNVNERSQYLAGVHPAERFVTFFLLKRMTNIDRARSRSRAYVTQTRVHVRTHTHGRRSHTHARARARALGVSTVLVNYIGTTVSPALFIVRYRCKLLSVRLVTSRFVTSTTIDGRRGQVSPTLRPNS